MWSKTKEFLADVRVELKKVTWPSRADTIGSTGVVLVVTFIISFYLGIIDVSLTKLITTIFG